ncbi:MAG: metalloregulator ArsR/SmtB family transcription factor [Phycisphaerae bacterium]|nr:metalloregulator ArsR/SmtB family transcription factor [Phycisphaerae bacterium]
MDSNQAQHGTAQPLDPVELLRALSDTTRMRIVQLLLIEELNVSELVEILGMPQSSVSRQLKTLRDAGIVNDRRVGVTSIYSTINRARVESKARPDEQLATLLTDWLANRPIPAAMHERLERVIRQRGNEGPGFFNRIGRRWDELRTEAFGPSFAMEAFISVLPREWHVADIGTGTGHLLPTLATHFESVLAVEPAEGMRTCAQQRVAQTGFRNVEIRAGDLTQLPIDSKSIDLAIAMLVLHHVASPDEALQEIARILRPGGRVLIVEQQAHENQDFYERMKDLWWGFDSDDLQRRLAAIGCTRIQCRKLLTAASQEGLPDSPPLFVLTATRSDQEFETRANPDTTIRP